MKILFVCTGNICRSPMAEALLREALRDRGIDDIQVSSAGIWGNDGWSATDDAAEVLSTRGVDLSSHVARTLTEEQVEEADLIVVMTAHHARDVEKLVPGAADKVRFLKELGALDPGDLDPAGTPAQRLHALLAVTRPPYRRGIELDDPYGLPVWVYERTATEIEGHVRHLAGILAGKTDPDRLRP